MVGRRCVHVCAFPPQVVQGAVQLDGQDVMRPVVPGADYPSTWAASHVRHDDRLLFEKGLKINTGAGNSFRLDDTDFSTQLDLERQQRLKAKIVPSKSVVEKDTGVYTEVRADARPMADVGGVGEGDLRYLQADADNPTELALLQQEFEMDLVDPESLKKRELIERSRKYQKVAEKQRLITLPNENKIDRQIARAAKAAEEEASAGVEQESTSPGAAAPKPKLRGGRLAEPEGSLPPHPDDYYVAQPLGSGVRDPQPRGVSVETLQSPEERAKVDRPSKELCGPDKHVWERGTRRGPARWPVSLGSVGGVGLGFHLSTSYGIRSCQRFGGG